jgi:glycosyltransferase involved in cell wall biosynthesis
VLPGYSSPELDAPLRERASDLGIADAVHFPGFMSDEDLDGLYRAARGFVMPSFTEGFGLPVLEAMQRGTPVACTRDSAPAEVGGEAAITFDPMQASAIAEAVVALLTDDALHARLSAAGPPRAQQFSWADCAARTLATYERALA